MSQNSELGQQQGNPSDTLATAQPALPPLQDTPTPVTDALETSKATPDEQQPQSKLKHEPSSLIAQLFALQHQLTPPHTHFQRSSHHHQQHHSAEGGNPFAIAALHLLNTTSAGPLWGHPKGREDLDDTFSQQVRDAGRVMRFAMEAKAATTTPRVAQVLQWFMTSSFQADPTSGHKKATRRRCDCLALAMFGANVLSLEDGGSNGSVFVEAYVLPMILTELEFGSSVPPLQTPSDALQHHEPHHIDEFKSMMLALQMSRMLCDEQLSIVTATTKKEPHNSSIPLPAILARLLNVVASANRIVHLTFERIARDHFMKSQLTIQTCNNPLSALSKLSLAAGACTKLERFCPTGRLAASSNTEVTNVPKNTVSVITVDAVTQLFQLIHKDVLALISRPEHSSGSGGLVPAIAKGTLLLSRPIDAIHIVVNLEMLFRFGVASAAEVASECIGMMPTILHRASPRDVQRFLSVLVRWRYQVAIVPDNVVAQAVEGCQQALQQKKLKVVDALGILVQLGKLRFPVPLDLVDGLVDACLAQVDRMTIAQCVVFVTATQRIIESEVSMAQFTVKDTSRKGVRATDDRHKQSWAAFRERKVDYALHMVLQHVQRCLERHSLPTTTATSDTPLDVATDPQVAPLEDDVVPPQTASANSGIGGVTVEDAIALVTVYADLNNASSSFAMYRLMRPQLAVLFESHSTPSVRVVATLLGSLASIKSATTTTFEEEELVRQAETESAILLSRCSQLGSRQAIHDAHLGDVIPLLSCVVQILAGEKESHHHAGDPPATTASSTPEAAANKELLCVLLQRADALCFDARGSQIGALARLTGRIHRLSLAPLDAYTSLMETVVRCSVTSFSRCLAEADTVVEGDEDDVTLQRSLMTGAQGGISTHDLCAVISLIHNIAEQDDVNLTTVSTAPQSLSGANHSLSFVFSMEVASHDPDICHVWAVMLQRIRFLASSVAARDLRQWMLLLANMHVLEHDRTLFQGRASQALTAVCGAVCKLSSSLQLPDIAALMASLHGIDRDLNTSEDEASARDDDAGTVDPAIDEGVDGNTSIIPPGGSNGLSFDAAARAAWHSTVTALALQATACLRLCRPPRQLPLVDVKWSVKLLKGLSDHLEAAASPGNEDEDVAVVPARVAFLYELLPVLMREAQSLSAVDLSLALHAYAKAGVWNVGAMSPLLRSACDGLALAPVRPCSALLHTLIKSGFVRRELMILPQGSEQMKGQRAWGSNEAMEHVVTLLVQRLTTEIAPAPNGGSAVKNVALNERELLSLLNSLGHFAEPPRPLFDTVLLELHRRVVHRTLTDASHFGAGLAPAALLANAHLLRLGSDHVAVATSVTRQYLESPSWHTSLMRQPTSKILKTLSLLSASVLFAAPDLTASEIASLETLLWKSVEGLSEASTPAAWLAQSVSVMETLYACRKVLPQLAETFPSMECIQMLADTYHGAVSAGTSSLLNDAAALKLLLLVDPAVLSGSAAAQVVSVATTSLLQCSPSSNVPFVHHTEVQLVRHVLAVLDAARIANNAATSGAEPVGTLVVQPQHNKALKEHTTNLLLWLSRKPSVDRIVWCLRVLARVPSSTQVNPLDATMVALDHLLVSAWSIDVRDSEALMRVVSLLSDSCVVAQLSVLPTAHFLQRFPIVLERLAARANRPGSLGMSFNASTHNRLVEVLQSAFQKDTTT